MQPHGGHGGCHCPRLLGLERSSFERSGKLLRRRMGRFPTTPRFHLNQVDRCLTSIERLHERLAELGVPRASRDVQAVDPWEPLSALRLPQLGAAALRPNLAVHARRRRSMGSAGAGRRPRNSRADAAPPPRGGRSAARSAGRTLQGGSASRPIGSDVGSLGLQPLRKRPTCRGADHDLLESGRSV